MTKEKEDLMGLLIKTTVNSNKKNRKILRKGLTRYANAEYACLRTHITAPFYALFCILQLQHMTVDNCRIEGYSALYPAFLCVKSLLWKNESVDTDRGVQRFGINGAESGGETWRQ